MKITFLGDISLNDNYVQLYKNRLNPFAALESMLRDNDFVVGNLESIAKGEQGENLLKKPRLTTTVDTLNYLKTLNVNLVSLAHNHIYDHLEDGFAKTTDFLDNSGILHVGAGFTVDEASKPLILNKNGITVGMLNYVTKDTNPNLPENAGIKLNIFEWQQAEKDIRELKTRVNHLVLLLHWGGRMEGSMYPDIAQPRLARLMIDAGADLIVGHHSHTLQPYEIYHGKYIFYSLGNFCFSDVSVNGNLIELDKNRTNPSIILGVDFEKTKYSLEIHEIINNNEFIEPCNSLVAKKVKQISFSNYVLYIFPFWYIYFFYEKKIYPILAYFFAKNRNPIKQLSVLKWRSLIKHLGRLINSRFITSDRT